MNQKELTSYLVKNMLIQIEYSSYNFMDNEAVIVLDTEENNVYHFSEFYTVPKETIEKIKNAIATSDIFSVRLDGEAFRKLNDVCNLVILDGDQHNIELKLDGKRCSYELENVKYMKKYFKKVDEYKRAYEVLATAARELKKAGIELDELASFLK